MGIGLCDAARAALEPYVGEMVADTCVRATALSLGKTTEELDRGDLSALESRIRGLLAPVAPLAVIDEAIVTLERAAAQGA